MGWGNGGRGGNVTVAFLLTQHYLCVHKEPSTWETGVKAGGGFCAVKKKKEAQETEYNVYFYSCISKYQCAGKTSFWNLENIVITGFQMPLGLANVFILSLLTSGIPNQGSVAFLTGYVFSGHCFTHLIVLLANFAMLEFLIAFINYLVNPMLSITNPNQMKQLTVLILSLSNYGLSSGFVCFFLLLSLFSSPFYLARPGVIGIIKLPPLTLTDSFIQIFRFICRTILSMSEQSKHHGIQRGFLVTSCRTATISFKVLSFRP